jgi:hypothetical protein
MAYNFQPSGAAHVLADWNPEDVKLFVQDRTAMHGGAPRMPAADAEGMYRSYLRRLANMLNDHPFLMGDAPSIADFSAYHPNWYTLRRVTPLAGILDATPNVRNWIERMEQFGHGPHTEITSTQSLEIAKAATPLDVSKEPFVDLHGIALGSKVVITSESFGLEPTHGELVAATRTRITVRRHDARAGTAHVHFPRVGFIMKKDES